VLLSRRSHRQSVRLPGASGPAQPRLIRMVVRVRRAKDAGNARLAPTPVPTSAHVLFHPIPTGSVDVRRRRRGGRHRRLTSSAHPRPRPRKYCEVCVPPGSGGTASHEAWLTEHHDELEARRRKEQAERMAESRRRSRENRATIAANRRRAEAKRKAA
jgi:hypothetical protein